MEFLVILIFMGIGALIFVSGVLKSFSKLNQTLTDMGGLEGLKAAHLQLIETNPAQVAPVVSPTGKVARARLTLGIALFCVLLSFGLGSFFQYRAIRAARLLENDGVVVTAQVTGKNISEDDDGYDTYYVSYTFDPQPAAGSAQAIERKDSVPYELYGEIELGAEIDVIYARSDPAVARMLALYKPGRVSIVPVMIGWIVGMAGALLALAFYQAYRNAARLDAEGLSTWVTVLDLFESSDSNRTSYYVAYALPDGQKIRQSVQPAIYQRLNVGDQIKVVYLPDRPKVFRPEWN